MTLDQGKDYQMIARYVTAGLLPALAVVCFVGSPAPAEAAPRLIEEFRAWKTFVNEDGGSKVCFAISEPVSSEMNPSGRNRGPQFFFVTYRPSENVRGEVSAAYGYPLREDSTRAEIGSDSFQLYARDESAWVRNSAEEPKLLDAMRAGATMKVYGTSTRGTTTIDTYSLSGVTAALQKIAEECP